MDVHPTKNVSIGIDPYPYLQFPNVSYPSIGKFTKDMALSLGNLMIYKSCQFPIDFTWVNHSFFGGFQMMVFPYKDPWYCYIYIWCAIDPINIYPLDVSIYIPAPWILWIWGIPIFCWQRFIQLQRLGDSQERRLQRNGPVGGVEVEEIPRGSGVLQHGDSLDKNPKMD